MTTNDNRVFLFLFLSFTCMCVCVYVYDAKIHRILCVPAVWCIQYVSVHIHKRTRAHTHTHTHTAVWMGYNEVCAISISCFFFFTSVQFFLNWFDASEENKTKEKLSYSLSLLLLSLFLRMRSEKKNLFNFLPARNNEKKEDKLISNMDVYSWIKAKTVNKAR